MVCDATPRFLAWASIFCSSSSEKPSFAFVAFKNLQPEKSIEFAHALQKVFFVEGKSLNEDETYKTLAKQFNINETEFVKALNSSEAKDNAFNEFELVKTWGISGFPAVVLFKDGKGYMVANGYSDLKSLENQIAKVLAEN